MSDSPDVFQCVELILAAADRGLERRVEAAIWELDVAGFERQDDTTWSELAEDPRPRPAGAIRWRIYGRPADLDKDRVDAALGGLAERLELEDWEIDNTGFVTAWREHFRPAQISDRVWVCPPWEAPPLEPGQVAVEIDPGMAFGTGTHPTTRLCTRIVDELLQESADASVLDVGTGTAILAIAAAKLGSGRIVGVDNDPIAVTAAGENAERNYVSDRLELSDTPVGDISETFDVVIANILPHILRDLKPALWARTQATTTLVLSGIPVEQAPAMAEAMSTDGRAVPEVREDGEWSALIFRPTE